MIEPGEIYFADLDVAGRRPVVIVSREELNRGHSVFVVPITSSRFAWRSRLANCAPFFSGEFGLVMNCVAQCESAISINKVRLELASGPIGVLDDARMRSLVHAMGFVIAADCEPTWRAGETCQGKDARCRCC